MHLLCPRMFEGIYITLPSLMGEEFQGVYGQNTNKSHTYREENRWASFLFLKENAHSSWVYSILFSCKHFKTKTSTEASSVRLMFPPLCLYLLPSGLRSNLFLQCQINQRAGHDLIACTQQAWSFTSMQFSLSRGSFCHLSNTPKIHMAYSTYITHQAGIHFFSLL